MDSVSSFTPITPVRTPTPTPVSPQNDQPQLSGHINTNVPSSNPEKRPVYRSYERVTVRNCAGRFVREEMVPGKTIQGKSIETKAVQKKYEGTRAIAQYDAEGKWRGYSKETITHTAKTSKK